MKAKIETTNNIEDIFFPVELVSTSSVMGGIDVNPDCVNSVIAEINGSKRLLSTCGERYNLLSNFEVYNPIMLMLDGYEYEVSIRMINNARFEVKFNITDERLRINVGTKENPDWICPQIVLNRSLDSGSRYDGHAGYFRFICKNGLVLPVENQIAFSAKGKHTEKLSVTLTKLGNVIDKIIGNASEISKKYEVLFDTQIVNFAERVEAVMSVAGMVPVKRGTSPNGESWERSDNLDSVVNTIKGEMKKLNLNVCNNWLIYNGINAFIYNDEMNVKTDSVRRELDQKVMSELIK